MPISIKGQSKLLDNLKNYPNTLYYFVVILARKQAAPLQERFSVQLNTKKQFKVAF